MAIGGTKIKANASRHKAMSVERMQQAEVELKAQIDALLERAKSAAPPPRFASIAAFKGRRPIKAGRTAPRSHPVLRA